MKDIALFYGSYTGVTRDIAKKLWEILELIK